VTDETARARVITQLDAYMRRVPQIPCAVVSLPGGEVEATSRQLRVLMGSTEDELTGVLVTAITRGLWRSEPMRLLRGGTQTGFSTKTSIRMPTAGSCPALFRRVS
jgi:hypothetical protein